MEYDSDDSPRSVLPSDFYSIVDAPEPGGEEEDQGSGNAPPRPKFLGEFIDAQKDHYDTFDDKYYTFLRYAIDAIDVANESPMVVNVALKVGKVGQEHGGGNGAMAHVGGNNAYSNNNFRKMFFFYSSFCNILKY